VAVHFITITERFAPHDFVLSITTPEELSDAALTAACTLHTAAPSSSSSSGSSRQQKLSWIQEAAEEGSQLGGDDSTTSRPATARSNIPTIMEPATPIDELPERNLSVISDGAESVPLILELLEEKAPEVKPAPEISHVTVEAITEGPETPDSDLTELQATMKSYDKLFENGPEPRSSSQTARPNYDELYEHYYAQYSKPKVKLGPRPRPSLDGQRPSTSGSVPQVASRPKSSLPAGLRSATRKAADQRTAKTRGTSVVPSLPTPQIPPLPPIPPTPEAPSSPISLAFTARTPASVRSMPVSAYRSHHRSQGMTQEKTRLMKALELRKKQQKDQVQRQEKMAEQAVAESQADAKDAKAEPTVHDAAADSMDVTTSVAADSVKSKTDADSEKRSLSSNGLESSGLVFSSSQADTDDLNSTISVSSPTSAQTQGSSGAPSTRPSSMSEDDTPLADAGHEPESVKEAESPDMVDEEESSVDSLPTVVPESRTPIPSVIHPSSQTTENEQDTPSDSEKEEVVGLTKAHTQADSQERRRSNRESMLFVPSGDASPLDDAMFKRRNRESVIMPNSKRQSWYETKEKRRAKLDPIHVSAENSEAEYLSDDSFMEELQSATVHEAKPMSVSKSPITPWFPRKVSEIGSITPERPSSQAYMRAGRSSPEQIQRKISGPWPPQVSADKVGVAKKINVSTGISQRIKALAEKSSRELSPPVTPVNSLDTPSHSLAQRKSSFFATTPVETSPNGRPISRLGNPAFLNSSASSSPDKRSALTPQPIKATVYNVQRAHTQPESVQVTARIVRDERTQKPTLVMPTENTPLDLHQSPLIIDHQKPKWSPRSPTRGRTEPASPKAPSTSHSRDQSTGPPRTSSESSWKAFGRRMSESKSIHSHEGEDKREDKKDKKESRTSKMFKRMSSSMSAMPWKNTNNILTLPEHDMRSTSLASLREPPPPVHVGDLNIQFPDTLLWKRRWVEIDAMGNLVLSPSKSNEKGIVKRFHLSEFRAPYPPDQDRQELPNSVVLDFVDGRTLQCACETYIAQAQVLQGKSASFPSLI
jgi:hypothetical protein